MLQGTALQAGVERRVAAVSVRLYWTRRLARENAQL